MSEPRKTPLAGRHKALGARMVDFHGWYMPIQYDGIIQEHLHTRAAVGAFDVSHMGQLIFRGAQAAEDLGRAVTCNVAAMTVGRCRYGLLLNEAGGIEDDLLVYRVAEHEFWLVVNASMIDKDAHWVPEHISSDTEFEDASARLAMIAVQGPKSKDALRGAVDADLGRLRYYRCTRCRAFGQDVLLSRTGYTGELGYELCLDAAVAERVWDAILALPDAKPIGLGARDTLRLEMGMPLYGADLTPAQTPVEAGLMRSVDLSKGFVGRDAVTARADAGPRELLIGFKMAGKQAARAGHEIMFAGEPVGRVTSGSFAPSVGCAIGMGHVGAGSYAQGDSPRRGNPLCVGAALTIDVRGKALDAVVAERPFYKDGTATVKDNR